MLELFTSQATTVNRATIMLEESGLPYKTCLVVPGRKKPALLQKANPQGRQPTLVDHNGPDDKPVFVTQSIAIVIYIAEKSGILIPSDPRRRTLCIQRVLSHATDLYPSFQAPYFMRWMKPHPNEDAARWWEQRMVGYFQELDTIFSESAFLAGDSYTIADVVAYPGVERALRDFPEVRMFKNIRRWKLAVGRRPTVRRGMAHTTSGAHS
ncbi:MAG: glutathione S-transferase family protein [Alphaproteobacteria bacterium]|uniref:glutathione S-transferase family protein n=1 Tax=Marinobacter salarius TaxID=1420917 RepID=UPI0032EEBF2C